MPLFGSPGIEKLKAKRDIKGLSLALKHENQIVRRTAARALGEIGDARAIEPLIAALEDEEWAMRQAVAEALDRLGWQPDGGRAEAVYWATKQQWDKCAKVGAPAMDPLIAVLRGELKNMHAAAAEALGKVASLTDDVRAVEPLIAKLRDSDICVRQAAAEALGRIGDIRAIEPLIGILEDEEWRVRAAAAKALGKVASLTGDTRAVEPLVAKLKDGDSDTRRAAAGALDELGWQPSQDENGAIYWVIRGECYRCVGIGPLAVEPLITALRGSDRRLRQAAAGALGEIGDTRAFEPLIVALRDRIPLVRYEAAKALSKVGGEKAIQPLLSALTYEDTQMCEVAIRAIEAIGSSEAVRPLRALLRRRTFGRDVNLIINEVLERLEGLYGQSASIVLGIDLGTSHSVCSVIARGEPVIIPSAEGDRLIPSVVATDLKTGERLVGRAAERQAVTNPENTIFSVKRFMGNKFNDPEVRRIAGHVPYEIGAAPNGDVRVWMGGKVYSPPEISAMILQKLRKDAEAYIGKEIARAVITVPAYFDDSQRQATRDAGRIAGLKVLRIINESTAAALAYGLDKKHDETIAVYHLGGGTFDISILEIGDGVFDVRSTHGDNFLGGDDWDQRIIDYVAGRFQKSHSIDLRKDTQALQRLKEASEKAKIELSTVEVTEIDLPFITTDVAGPKHLRMRLTRPNLEKLTMDLLERTIDSCKLALEEANLKPGQVHNVILVGGMTRMPAVQQKVTSFFSKAPHKGVNPDEVVGIGAGIQAGVFSGRIDDVLLLDVTPLTLGIETEDGKAASVIERNTTIPTRKSHICTTARDNQAQVDIHVIQGEHSEAAQNKSLGKFIFGGIQPASRGVPKIEVVFDIDADGVLNVVAKDKDTGRKQSMQVVPFSGLTEKEVERMTQEARHYYEQDLRKKRKVELRNDADNTLYAAEKLLQEQGDGMSLHLRHGIESRVERLKKALVNGDTDLVRQCIDKLSYALLQVQSAADQDVIYL